MQPGGHAQTWTRGSGSLGGQLGLTGGYTPQPGDSFMVVRNDGSGAVSGTFTGLPQGGYRAWNGVLLQVDYAGGDGNDIVLTRVTAPPATLTGATVLSNGHVVITGQGLGFVRYTIEAATNLVPPVHWSVVGTPWADAAGAFSVADTNAPLYAMRFYRAVSP